MVEKNYILTESQIKQIRADAIDECINELRVGSDYCIQIGEVEVAVAVRMCIKGLEMLKEQKK